jgi:Fe-S-cluster containining protein
MHRVVDAINASLPSSLTMAARSPLLVVDPDQVAVLGRARKDAHWLLHDRLAQRLEQGDLALAARIDTLLRSISGEVDCTRCGRCCVRMGPTVDDAAVERIAHAMGLSAEAYRDRFCRPMWPGCDDAEQVWVLPDPCPMHDGLLCTVYEARPQVCRDFPREVGATTAQRLAVMVETASICPIAFNLLESLDDEPM